MYAGSYSLGSRELVLKMSLVAKWKLKKMIKIDVYSRLNTEMQSGKAEVLFFWEKITQNLNERCSEHLIILY